MEKISNIVRGSARVASTDAKAAGAVRPGAPSFGRPIGESQQIAGPSATTAMRAVALHNEMNEAKLSRSQDNTVAFMADQFFMTRLRRPEEEAVTPPISKEALAKISGKQVDVELDQESLSAEKEAAENAQPSGYVPRGSYVNVEA